MAKNNNKDGRGGKIKISVLQFELEGSDETLQEGLRTVSETLSRSFPQAQRVIKQLPASPRLALAGEEPTEEDYVDQVEEPEYEAPAPPAPRSKSVRQYRRPESLDDIDPAADVSFRDFCADKDTSSDLMKYLVLASWYKEHRDIEEIGADHAYTIYKFMSWKVPKDMSQTFRTAKSQKAWFKSGSEKGTFIITHIGLDVVTQMGNTAP